MSVLWLCRSTLCWTMSGYASILLGPSSRFFGCSTVQVPISALLTASHPSSSSSRFDVCHRLFGMISVSLLHVALQSPLSADTVTGTSCDIASHLSASILTSRRWCPVPSSPRIPLASLVFRPTALLGSHVPWADLCYLLCCSTKHVAIPEPWGRDRCPCYGWLPPDPCMDHEPKTYTDFSYVC